VGDRTLRFLLIDRITCWEPGKHATVTKNVALSDDFFDDHFPQKPIMPGVLILEGMAQLAGLLLEETLRRSHGRSAKALMSIVEKAKFRNPVYPGDRLEYHVKLVSLNESGGKVAAQATRDQQLCAECALVFAFHDFEDQRLERQQREVVSLWMSDLP